MIQLGSNANWLQAGFRLLHYQHYTASVNIPPLLSPPSSSSSLHWAYHPNSQFSFFSFRNRTRTRAPGDGWCASRYFWVTDIFSGDPQRGDLEDHFQRPLHSRDGIWRCLWQHSSAGATPYLEKNLTWEKYDLPSLSAQIQPQNIFRIETSSSQILGSSLLNNQLEQIVILPWFWQKSARFYPYCQEIYGKKGQENGYGLNKRSP